MEKRPSYVSLEAMVKSDVYNCDGCAQYSFFNAGNVNVSIDGIMVLKPREAWEGPDMHPDVAYFSKHRIDFDEANAPTELTPVGGQLPPPFVLGPADPPPPIDRRMIIQKTYVK